MSHEAPRVGIVLVSHSARLAEGAADLASQVSGGTVRVLAAGGTEDGELGTSAGKIARAVAGAEAGAGVLVLPDLGSAVLTVRALLADAEFAEPGLTDMEGPGTTEGRANTDGPADTGSLADSGSLAGTPGARVVLVDAPFVEGAVAATVTAAAGADLPAVAAAAEEAWHARKL
jgi:PTS hybrid protein